MKKETKNIIAFFILLLASIMMVGSVYYSTKYSKQEFDQIIYYLLNGVENTSPSVIKSVIGYCIIPLILLCTFLCIISLQKTKNNIYLILKTKKKQVKIQIYPIKIIANHRKIYLTIVFLTALIMTIHGFKIDKYIKNRFQETKIYDEYYVDGREKQITFPEKKRNLIIIIAESLENSTLSKENGGAWPYSIMPELEKLAMENTNFSNTDKIGGAYQLGITSFSAGGIVATTAGIPLQTRNILTDINVYKGNGNYLGGAYTLGDILKNEGYNLEVIMGSDGNFGGRTQYFNAHGQYKIFDVNYAIENGKMTDAEKVWWGFEDDRLFMWSKEEITELAKENKPFNYIMLTADTHFVDGYLSKNAENKFNSQYENVHAYSSKLINDFVKWLKEQDFYENTTIVIVGDHLGMQDDFYKANVDNTYTRTVYNAIINPAVKTTNNKNRIFTNLDFYPTILASIGVNIEGNRLGLGTNLYSQEPTLAEKFGFLNLDQELKKNSSFYNNKLLGDDYYVMKKNTQKESEVKNEENINNNTSIQ